MIIDIHDVYTGYTLHVYQGGQKKGKGARSPMNNSAGPTGFEMGKTYFGSFF